MGLLKWPQASRNQAWLDRIGLTLSIGCAVHCLAVGLFFLLLPGLFEISHHHSNFEFLNSVWVHAILAVLVIPIAIYSLGRGYQIHHQRLTLILGLPGLVLITAGLIVHPDPTETALTFTGGLLLALAHFINLKRVFKSR